MAVSKKNNFILRDMVNEKFLLEQVAGLYQCPNGYGYNPFTKQCYPIISGFDVNNYSSLAPSKTVITVGKDGKDGKEKRDPNDLPGYDISKKGLKELFIDVLDLFSRPIESAKECYDKHPIATIFGVMTGTGVTARAIRSTFKVGYGAVRVLGLGSGAAGVGMLGIVSAYALWSVAQNIKSKYDELRSMNYLELAQGLLEMEQNLESIEKNSKYVHKITDLTKKAEEQTGGPLDVNKGSISCFVFITTGTFAIKKMATAGLRTAGLAAIRQNKIFLKNIGSRLFKNTSNLIKRNFKGSHSDAYIFLKTSGLLPESGGRLKAVTKGVDEMAVEIVDSSAEKIRIPVNNFPDDIRKSFNSQFKKLIEGDDVVVDISVANQELAKISRDSFLSTQKLYEKEAGNLVKSSTLIDDIKKIRKIIARGGSLNSKEILYNYFKASSEILEDIVTNNKNKLMDLQEAGIQLKKLKPNLSGSDLKKAHEQIMAGVSPPNVSAKYVAKYRQYIQIEKDLYQKFSVAKQIMEKDAKFTKMYSNQSNTASLKEWFTTPNGRKAKSRVEQSSDFLKNITLDLYDVGRSTSLFKALKFFAYSAFVGGSIYFGPKITKRIRNELSLPVIDKRASEFFKNVVSKNSDDYYLKERLSKKVKVEKLFKDFETYYLQNLQPDDKRTIPAFKELIKFATITNKKDVEKFFNEQGEVRAGVDGLEKDFRSFLAMQLGDDEPEEVPEEVPEKNKKDTEKSAGLLSQVPAGELVGKPSFTIKTADGDQKIQFTKRFFKIQNSQGVGKFKFVDPDFNIDGNIDSVRKKGNQIIAKLSAGFIDKTFSLREEDLINLLARTKQLTSKGDDTLVSLGGESGKIKKIEENKGINIMTTKNLKEVVKQIMNENSGMGYQKYPYNPSIEDEEREPAEDYVEEWKALSLNLVRDETRNVAIQIAKILVKDLELFEDVLDLAGQNQSIGTEILQKLKEVEFKK